MSYERINWEDDPSKKTPINAENLNHMDEGIKQAHQMLDSTAIISKASGTIIELTDSADAPLAGLKVYGNERPSSNLLEYPRDYSRIFESFNMAGSESFCGIDWTINDDGSITINGTARYDEELIMSPNIELSYSLNLLVGADEWDEVNNQTWTKTIVCDVGLSDESVRNKMDFVINVDRNIIETKTPHLVTCNSLIGTLTIMIKLHEGETFDNVTIYPQLNSDSLKPWEACVGVIQIENQITVSMSNDTETKDVVIPIDTLWGYKETKVGDSEARDYIDFERKKLVKYYNYEFVLSSAGSRDMNGLFFYDVKVPDDVNPYQCVLKNSTKYKRVTIDDVYSDAYLFHTPCYVNDITTSGFAVNNPRWEYMSDEEVNAELSANPLVFVFPTYEPIEYDLTDEQIEAFEQMKTFYGRTTISTDCGAILDVEYVADTKLYVDQHGGGGENVEVTTANITKALGYTPANKTDVDSLSEEIVNQILVLTESELESLTQEELVEQYAKGTKLIVTKEDAENLVPKATDSMGNVYLGRGYRNNYRLKSDGTIVEARYSTVTGFMPCIYGSKISVVGWGSNEVLTNGGQYIAVFDENYNLIETIQASTILTSGIGTENAYKNELNEITIDTSKRSSWSNIKYFRVSCINSGDNVIASVDKY